MKDAYLEMLPLKGITKYCGGQPKNAMPFAGHPRPHPSEKNKIILVHDPLGAGATVLEFKIDDILFMEEIPSAVTESGEGIPLVRLWVRKGSHGIMLEPFEVDSPIRFADTKGESRERFMGSGVSGGADGRARI